MAIPAYQRIIQAIQQWIQKGDYKKDEKLPSEARLMEEFSTSRITVTRALKELELKGVIYRVKGKGSFVAAIQSHRQNENRIISLVLPHKADFFSGGQQYSRKIASCCRDFGYLCSLHYSDQSISREKKILQEIAAHNVAGAIIYPISNRNISSLSLMSIQGFPMVMLDRSLDELSLPVVTSDNFKGAYDAVSYLTGKGHKSIGFVGANDSDVVTQRYKGYCRALTDSRIPVDRELIVTEFAETEEDQQSMLHEEEALRLLKDLIGKGISALFCVNDLIAYRLLFAAEKLGIRLPDELSLVGFDNMRYLADTSWRLTTVAQDFETIARESVSILIDMIEKGEEGADRSLVVPTRLIEGNTVANCDSSH